MTSNYNQSVVLQNTTNSDAESTSSVCGTDSHDSENDILGYFKSQPTFQNSLPILPIKAGNIIPILKCEPEPIPPLDWPFTRLTDSQIHFVLDVSQILAMYCKNQKESKWCDTECIIRYCKTTKWDKNETSLLFFILVARLKSTLDWRNEYKPDEITRKEIEEDNKDGKAIISGFDRDCRPIIWLTPSFQKDKKHDELLRFLTFMVEKVTTYFVNF
jgi:hypothetical protein